LKSKILWITNLRKHRRSFLGAIDREYKSGEAPLSYEKRK